MIDRPLSIFIASASEGLDVANAVRDALRGNTGFEPRVWNEGTFKPSMTFIEALEAELAQSDFAVLTLTPDDQSESRGQMTMAPRDNVLFELGLFMGRLGRDRTYFVCDKNQELKIPTDLLGVSPVSYQRGEGQDLGEALATACSSIVKRMRELGVRLKRTPEAEIENRLVSSFCERIAGTWWGRQWSHGEERLSLFQIVPDHGANTVQLDGDTFDTKGQLFGQWKSVAIGIRLKERTLFFSWEGVHPVTLPGESFKGFGQYTFKDASGKYDRGDGLFADIYITRKKAARWTSVELRRVDMADLDRIGQVMKNGTDSTRASEVMKVLDGFRGRAVNGSSLIE
jgi:hypothetical protein